MNLLNNYGKKAIASLLKDKQLPNFKAGDTLKVYNNIVEGSTKRVQVFEGVCIARRNSGLGSTFTVRKISNGKGIEKIFPLYSPNINNIEVAKIGRVRRAKLYYLRKLVGKAARIKEMKK